MAERDPAEQPPPYSPPAYPETQPPPYSPVKDDGLHPGVPGTPVDLQYTSYGAAGAPQKQPDTYPPGAPPFCPPEAIPLANSTSLLITREQKPPTFLILSIMTCICFSPLFGLIAVIFSCLSDAAWGAGDIQSARRYSQVAISLSVVGILLTVFTVVLIFVTGAVRVH